MKKTSIILVLSLATLTGMTAISCSFETHSKNISVTDSTKAIPVEFATVKRDDISAYYSSTATLEAEEEAMVTAKVRGTVNEIIAEEGEWVNKGDILARLEDEQLEIEGRRAEARMNRLKNEFERKKELFEKELISAEEFENAKFEFQAQKSDFDLAQLKIKYSKISAPISGILTERRIKVGNIVTTDQEVFKVTDYTPLLAILNVPEHEMNKLKKGQEAILQADALNGESFKGKVLRISPTVNPETGTFKVTVSISNETQRLKPGMFGRVQIVYDIHKNSLFVPKNSVISEDGQSSVYVIKNRVAYKKTVITGYENGNNIEIIQGISPADSVVTIGQSSLRDSTMVEIVGL